MNGKIAARIGAFTAIIGAVVVIFLTKERNEEPPAADDGVVQAAEVEQAAAADPLPTLVEFGSDSCIPCKKMAPILDQLEKDFAGQFNVEFRDIRKHPELAKPHGVNIMPTQIFFDADGNELDRHIGFISRNDIMKLWEKHGYSFTAALTPSVQYVAMYLHNTVRCEGCLQIEAAAKAVMERTFAEHLASSDLAWQALDMEQPEHEHYQDDFMLTTPSLVLVRAAGGAIEDWTVLEDVWEHMHAPTDLEAYIIRETEQFMTPDVDA